MIEPIRRVLGARPGHVEPVGPLRPLERVERDERHEKDEDPPRRRKPRERRPPAGDGHVDVEA